MTKKKKKLTRKATKKKVSKKAVAHAHKGKVPKLTAAIAKMSDANDLIKLPLTHLPHHTPSAKKRELLPTVGDLTERLSELIDLKAGELLETANYCVREGLSLQGTTVKDCLIHNLIAQALRGNDTALVQLWNRIDGRPVQKTEVDIRKRVEAIVLMKDLDLDLETRRRMLTAIRKHKRNGIGKKVVVDG